MRASDKKKIHRMEVEDDLGIRRGVRKRFAIPVRLYKIIKLCLIIAVPVVYFICSPLLIVVVLAYFGMIFLTNGVEKSLNRGLRKDLHVHLPKADSILCVILIVIAVAGTVVSSVSTGQKKSKFQGMNATQIEAALERKPDDTSFRWTRVWNTVKNTGALLTGTRYFFREEQTFGGRGGGKGGRPSDMGEPPEGFEPPSGEFPSRDVNQMLSELPFSIVFQSVVKAVNTGLLVLVCISGLLSFRKLKKATE